MALISISPDCNYRGDAMSITNKLNQIKNAIYGKEVRGAIHDAIKECYDDASVNHDNANMEVKMARGTHNTLNDRLDKSDEIQAQTNAQLSQKAEYAYVDTKVTQITSGSPKGVYGSLDELKEARPTGDNGIYLTSADGRWNYWNGNEWISGGVYQSTSLADESITADKLNTTVDYEINKIENWEIGSIGAGDGKYYNDVNRIRLVKFLKVKKNSVLKLKTVGDMQFIVTLYDVHGNFIRGTGWNSESYIISEECNYLKVSYRYVDDRVITSDMIKIMIANLLLYNTSDSNDYNFNNDFELGGISMDGSCTDATNRIRTKNYIYSSKNQIVKLMNEDTRYQLFAVYYNDDLTLNSTSQGFSNTNNTIIVPTNIFKLAIRRVDDANFKEEEIKKLQMNVFVTNNRYVDSDNVKYKSITDHHLVSKLHGKKLLNLGDSIAEASTAGVDGYHEIIAKKHNMKVVSLAKGGATITDILGSTNNIVNQVNGAIASDYNFDYILFDGLTNDAGSLSTSKYGEITEGYNDDLDTSTFCGAFEYICKSLKKKWFEAKIIYIRPHNMASRTEKQIVLGELAEKICAKWSIPVANIYKEGSLNTQLDEFVGIYTISDTDRTHPNTQGYQFAYVPIIESKLKNI